MLLQDETGSEWRADSDGIEDMSKVEEVNQDFSLLMTKSSPFATILVSWLTIIVHTEWNDSISQSAAVRASTGVMQV